MFLYCKVLRSDGQLFYFFSWLVFLSIFLFLVYYHVHFLGLLFSKKTWGLMKRNVNMRIHVKVMRSFALAQVNNYFLVADQKTTYSIFWFSMYFVFLASDTVYSPRVLRKFPGPPAIYDDRLPVMKGFANFCFIFWYKYDDKFYSVKDTTFWPFLSLSHCQWTELKVPHG